MSEFWRSQVRQIAINTAATTPTDLQFFVNLISEDPKDFTEVEIHYGTTLATLPKFKDWADLIYEHGELEKFRSTRVRPAEVAHATR